MSTPVSASDNDLLALADMVSEVREDLPERGLPLSLLRDLMNQIPCDCVLFQGYDTKRLRYWFGQQVPDEDVEPTGPASGLPVNDAFWQHFWDCKPCSYPDRTGDLRSIVQVTDFYSVREFRSTGMYSSVYRPQGFQHHIGLFLPAPRPDADPAQTARLFLLRGPGPDFSERDRALLTLLRPHIQQAFLNAERRRNPVPDLTPRHWELLQLIAAGRTNTQIARHLGLSEGTVRTHLEHIYGRLQVSNRTAAVIRAFPEQVA